VTNLTTRERKNSALRALLTVGYSAADVAHAVGVSERTVRRGGLVDHPSSARAGTTSPAVKARRRQVERLHKKNPRLNSDDIANELAKGGIIVSKRTITRDQNALGARHLTCDRVQRLTDLQKANRLRFAKDLIKQYPEGDDFWKLIVFSDETKRGTSDMDQTQWVYPGEARGEREQQRWDAKIHVWGYIGTDGVRCIELLPEHTVTKDTYLDLLKRTIGKRTWKDKRFWQQDNATAHTAAVVKNWLDLNVKCAPKWPANSPDLSPIENLWGCMWRDAMKSRPDTKEKLWESVQKTFREYSNEFIDNLVLSFRRRLLKVIEKKGDSISGEY
jgi:hypothetical protein